MAPHATSSNAIPIPVGKAKAQQRQGAGGVSGSAASSGGGAFGYGSYGSPTSSSPGVKKRRESLMCRFFHLYAFTPRRKEFFTRQRD